MITMQSVQHGLRQQQEKLQEKKAKKYLKESYGNSFEILSISY